MKCSCHVPVIRCTCGFYFYCSRCLRNHNKLGQRRKLWQDKGCQDCSKRQRQVMVLAAKRDYEGRYTLGLQGMPGKRAYYELNAKGAPKPLRERLWQRIERFMEKQVTVWLNQAWISTEMIEEYRKRKAESEKFGIPGDPDRLHIREPRVEQVGGTDKVDCVRFYTAIYAPVTGQPRPRSRRRGNRGKNYTEMPFNYANSKYKDIHQDPESKDIVIHPGQGDMFVSLGRPRRQVGFFYKYKYEGLKKQDAYCKPLIRSFLVQRQCFDEIVEKAVLEKERANSPASPYNVDQNGGPNQFGFTQDWLRIIQFYTVPGSMITYMDPDDPLSVEQRRYSGECRSIQELADDLGIPNKPLFDDVIHERGKYEFRNLEISKTRSALEEFYYLYLLERTRRSGGKIDDIELFLPEAWKKSFQVYADKKSVGYAKARGTLLVKRVELTRDKFFGFLASNDVSLQALMAGSDERGNRVTRTMLESELAFLILTNPSFWQSAVKVINDTIAASEKGKSEGKIAELAKRLGTVRTMSTSQLVEYLDALFTYYRTYFQTAPHPHTDEKFVARSDDVLGHIRRRAFKGVNPISVTSGVLDPRKIFDDRTLRGRVDDQRGGIKTANFGICVEPHVPGKFRGVFKTQKNASMHQFARRYPIESDIVREMFEYDIPFIGGPSGTTRDYFKLLLLYPNIHANELSKWAMLNAAYMVARGYHSFYECFMISIHVKRDSKLVLTRDVRAFYEQFLTQELIASDVYQKHAGIKDLYLLCLEDAKLDPQSGLDSPVSREPSSSPPPSKVSTVRRFSETEERLREVDEDDVDEDDHHWYTCDEIDRLLGHYLSGRDDVYIMRGLLADLDGGQTVEVNLRDARLALLGTPMTRIVVPINLGENHWTALYIAFDLTKEAPYLAPAVVYANPLGNGLPGRLRDLLLRLFPRSQVQVSNTRYQSDGHNCGPWTVYLLTQLAQQGALPPARGVNIDARRRSERRVGGW